MTTRKLAAMVAAVPVLAIGGVVAADQIGSSSEATDTLVTITTVYDPATQIPGPCSIATPPKADVCLATQGILRYAFWAAIVNSSLITKWKAANPGEWNRLMAHMAAPNCPNGSAPAQDMITPVGAALASELNGYACALGTEPVTVPAANAPPTSRADQKPPTPPGAVTVVPEPVTTT